LLGATKADHSAARTTETWLKFQHAMEDLLLAHGNGALVALAVLGFALALAVRTPGMRRLAWLGVAMTVPGILNYTLMLAHALGHVFWSLQGFAGLCALASIVPLVGMQWLRQDVLRLRIAGAALVLAAAATATWGAYCTHALIGRFEFVDNGTPAIMQKALPWLDRCSWALTSAPGVPQVFFGHTQTWANIDTTEKLQISLHFARQSGLRGRVGFVVDPEHRNTALTTFLDTMATPIAVDDIVVYEFTL
ncbi:MAG: hypothetical protein ABIP94_25385, partial [Planctomycetota bacterium]